MIAVDTNVLVHAHRADSPLHDRARHAISSLANGVATWAIPWPCIHEFLAIVTHPRIYRPPTPTERAFDQVVAWFEAPSLVALSESEVHLATLRALVEDGRVAGPQIHDARIAALCVQHGVSELWTADRDFGRFPRLRTVNPLVTER